MTMAPIRLWECEVCTTRSLALLDSKRGRLPKSRSERVCPYCGRATAHALVINRTQVEVR